MWLTSGKTEIITQVSCGGYRILSARTLLLSCKSGCMVSVFWVVTEASCFLKNICGDVGEPRVCHIQ